MPSKNLTTPFARDGLTQRAYKFGGGANTITTEDGFYMDAPNPAGPPIFVPYGTGYKIDAGGGNDTITGSDISILRDPVTGEIVTDADGEPIPTGDILVGGTGSDTISGGLGDDVIKGGTDDNAEKFSKKSGASSNDLYGESISFSTNVPVAGDDEITGGNGATNNMFGDYRFVSNGDSFTGGNDTLTGGDATADFVARNFMYGDSLSGTVSVGETYEGGIDTITGGDGADNLLVGDAQSINPGGAYDGGDDVLIGGDNGINEFHGDWVSGGAIATAVGGDDMLTGGVNSTNEFWFVENNGSDTITNFNASTDEIFLNGTGLAWDRDLDTSGDNVLDDLDAHVSVTGTTTVIDLGAAAGGIGSVDTITFLNLTTALVETDFTFMA